MVIQRILLSAVLLLSLSGGSLAQAAPGEYKLIHYEGSAQSIVTAARLLSRSDVILFGEYHDNTVLHQLELELLQSLIAVRPELTLSLEMFERDVQPQLDAYLAGTVSEQDFLLAARPWPNYRSDYRPLVEFAKAQALPVLAANIPRPLAAQLARSGSLDGIAPEQAVYLPQRHSAPPGEYRDRFFAQMNSMRSMRVSSEQLESYYRAQCLKDDTMAESIVNHLQAHPGRGVLHVQGDFHSRYRLGVAEKLRQLNPELKVLVIAPVYVPDFKPDTVETALRHNRDDGDYLLLIRQQ